MDDKEILEKFRSEDTKTLAFNHLVKKYQQKIYGLTRKMVIDHEDADDLTQETFIKAWNSLANFRGESQIFTWLYRVATNECLAFLNKKRKRFFLSTDDVANELTTKLEDGNLITGDEIAIKLQKAILTLPDKQRLVFNMKYFEEMKYEQMSEILGTSVGALKASYHIAVKKIEEILLKCEV